MIAREKRASALDVGGIETRVRCEIGDQPFIGCDVVEDAAQESRLVRRGANLRRPDAGYREETAKPLTVAGDKCKGLNRKRFGLFTGESGALFHRAICLSVRNRH